MATLRLTVGIAMATIAPQLPAQQASDDPISGHVSLGIRSVDVTGAVTKYREDLNLDDGVRIFDVGFRYVPAVATAEVVDSVDFSATSLGGDPFETLHFGARKYGAYRLALDRRKSAYFYDDVILPEALASVPASTAGDHHRFDFERIRDTAELDLDLSPRTKLNVALEHTTREGDSTTTLDIARDEFELERPFDESTNVVQLGVEHAWDKLTLIFDEQAREFDNASELLLPGADSGANPTDLSELLLFRFDQTYDFSSRGHTLRALARPGQRAHVNATWHSDDLELDLGAAERSSGIDFAGAPFTTDFAGRADIGRDIDMWVVDGDYRVGRKITLTGSLRSRQLDQTGTSLLDVAAGLGHWDLDSTGLELGASVAFGPRWLASFGGSREERDVTHLRSLDADVRGSVESTDRVGTFARVEYRAPNGLTLSASAEDNSIDDPFALGSPTDSERIKLSLRHTFSSGVGIVASLRRTSLENRVSVWAADTDEAAVRVSYARARLVVSAGYTAVGLSRDIDQLVTGGTRQDLFAAHYDADATLVDATARWQLNDRILLGGTLSTYTNDGSYPIDRDDARAFVEIGLRVPYSLRIAYREVDYAEDRFDDYAADLLEVAIGVEF